ncbi:MAG: hypothetical protein JNJ71_08935 [Rubrivivax sp.]|nr:hypothetical protein [Rubrivivax sp.]
MKSPRLRPPMDWIVGAAARRCAAGLLALAGAAAQAQTPAPAPQPAAPAQGGPISIVSPERTVRAEFGLPLNAAQQLITEGKPREALTKLLEAEAIPSRTPWETWVLERTRATAAQRAGDTPLVMKSIEAALATGMAEPAEELQLVEAMVGSAARDKDHARVLRWAKRYDELQGPNDAVRVMRIQSQAESGDEAGAMAALNERVAAADKAGRATPESHLRLLLSLQYRAREAGATQTLERLVASTPRPEYWADLVSRAAREPGLSDRALLELYRLLRVTGNLKAGDLRYEMAQIALRVGQPGEALAVVEEAYAANVMGTGAQAADHNRFRDQARRLAAADKADRAAAEAAAKRAPDGTALADLGWAIVASAAPGAAPAELEPGLALIEQGVAKGGLRRAAEARLHLGMAQLAAGRKDAGKQTLASLAGQAGSDPLALPIRLWHLYAQAPAMLPSRQ